MDTYYSQAAVNTSL